LKIGRKLVLSGFHDFKHRLTFKLIQLTPQSLRINWVSLFVFIIERRILIGQFLFCKAKSNALLAILKRKLGNLIKRSTISLIGLNLCISNTALKQKTISLD